MEYTQKKIDFKGSINELLKIVNLAKIEARKQVEGTNILPSLPHVSLKGRKIISISHRHLISEIIDCSLVPNSNIYEGTVIYGVDSNWLSIKILQEIV